MNIVSDIVNNLKRNLPFVGEGKEDGEDKREASNIKVSEVMSSEVESVSRITKIADAARTMRDSNVGFLPVVDNGKLVGVITDRDITVRVVAEGRDPAATPVDRFYTPGPITIGPDASVEQAAELMGREQIRRLLVIENGNIVGVLSLGDVAVKEKDEKEVGEVLSQVSEPGGPHQNEPNHG